MRSSAARSRACVSRTRRSRSFRARSTSPRRMPNSPRPRDPPSSFWVSSTGCAPQSIVPSHGGMVGMPGSRLAGPITTDQDVLDFNPFLPEVHADPYPVYRRFRELDPVHQTMMPGVWLLTRYAECLAVLRDDRRFSSDSRNSDVFLEFRKMFADQVPELLDETRARSMLFVDPPDHTRLRTLVNKAFTARVVESMAPHIRELVEGLLDGVEERGDGTFDVIADVAYPLPVTVICEMLAIPEEDRAEFRRWSPDLVRALDPFIGPEILPQVNAAAEWFRAYFERAIEERRRSPGDDVLSRLVHAQEHGDRLTREEV